MWSVLGEGEHGPHPRTNMQSSSAGRLVIISLLLSVSWSPGTRKQLSFYLSLEATHSFTLEEPSDLEEGGAVGLGDAAFPLNCAVDLRL